MKSLPTYLHILIVCLFFISCNNQKEVQEEQQQEQFEDAYYTTEELQERAARDSDFAKSKEYALQMENAAIEMSKNTFNMEVNEKLFLEFETALKALKHNTDELKKNPDLSKDPLFMKTTQAKADKVLACQQSLKKAKLNPTEEMEFYDLCHQK